MAKRKSNPVSHVYTHYGPGTWPFWEMGELLDNLELLMATLGKFQFRQVNLKVHPWKKDLTSFRDSGKQSLIGMQKQRQNDSKNIFSKRILTACKKKQKQKTNFSKKLVTWVGKLNLVQQPETQLVSSYSFGFCIIVPETWLKFLKAKTIKSLYLFYISLYYICLCAYDTCLTLNDMPN